MSNEELKLEVIRKAYGEHWIYFKDNLFDENGYSMFTTDDLLNHEIWGKITLDKHPYANHVYRPKSLAGIENNRGWISMHSIHDLEIKKGQYYTIFRNGYIEVSNYDGTAECYKFWKLNFTHYQPIIKPELPLW